MTRRKAIALLAVLAWAVAGPAAWALSHSGEVGGAGFTVYAPDWTWQKRDINILVVLDNPGAAPAEFTLDLTFPEGKEDHFGYIGKDKKTYPYVDETGQSHPIPAEALHLTTSVSAGGSERQAFTNITAFAGVPRQEYAFGITVRCGGETVQVPYPVQTVRGAVVPPGKLALFLPGGIALAWCLVFAFVVRRFARRGAWKVASEPIKASEEREAWIDQTP
jgi:hypothetical protein